MTQTVDATFDGTVIRPDQPMLIEPNTRVRISVEVLSKDAGLPATFLQTARNLKLKGPRNWSEDLDQYLYSDHA